ncbi:MAG: hypothetical protein KGD59_02105 [Candidatus Heimdallarchaeota archaeon]|nr:hypothetical protein [Candidatus Heimdallarchaeota archaeon]MBY8993314.1 hypothetical protein [Candidatus Heimdallarchaeota archaeon]
MVNVTQRLKQFSDKQINILFIVFIFVVSVLLRFPTFFDLQNTDVWYLIWESRLIFDARHLELIMHPFSLVGLYPFSPYPFGSLLLYRFFDLISFKNVFVGVMLFNICMIFLTTLSSYYFFRKVFNNNEKNESDENASGLNQRKILALIGSLIFVNFPYLTYFSYNFASARFPLMALLPLFYLFVLETINKRSVVSFLKCLGVGIAMLFFHRMSEPLLLLLLFLGIYLIFFKFLAKKLRINELIPKLKKIFSKYFIIFLLGAFAIAVVVSFFIDVYSGLWVLGTGVGWWQFLAHVTLILGGVFFEGWGSMIFVSLLGIIFINSKKTIKDKSYYNILLMILFQIPLLILISNHYIIYLISLVPVLLILLYLKNYIFEKENYNPIYGAIVLISFGLFNTISAIFIHKVRSNYHQAYIIISSFVFLFGIVLLISMLVEKQKQKNQQENMKLKSFVKGSMKSVAFILVVSFLFYSRFYIDLLTIYVPNNDPDFFPSITLTEEEKEIANFMSQYPNYLFGCSQRLVAIRVSVLSGCFYVADTHSLALLLSGYYNISEIRENTVFRPFYGGWDFTLYRTTTEYKSGREIFSELVQMEANATSLAIINDIYLSFFITSKHNNYVEIGITEYIFSPFVETISNIATSVFETTNYRVWAF